tara:strand:- start:493 stop:900 length:408 start_codon:yes stop_codon:yes gene_type:complete
MIIAKLHQCVYNAILSLCLKYKNKGDDMFYNTVHNTGKRLEYKLKKARNQKHKCLAIFQANPYTEYTPEIMHADLVGTKDIHENTPLTSIRRAFSDLKKEGLILKTKNKHIGNYGRRSYTWILNNYHNERLWGID